MSKHKVDKMNRVDLVEGFRQLKRVSDEAEILLEQRRLQEEEVWFIFEQHMESWEPTEKTLDSIFEKDLANEPNTATQKGKSLEEEWEAILLVTKDHGWSTHEEEMPKFWKEKENVKAGNERMKLQQVEFHGSCVQSMSTTTSSSSAPLSFTSEQDFESDPEPNAWNELMIALAYHECILWLQRCLCEGELCRVALSSHIALDVLTVGSETRSEEQDRMIPVNLRA